ncbi:MAG: ADP-ribosylglycohydrolase family protein [Dermatophilaceae bacterium]
MEKTAVESATAEKAAVEHWQDGVRGLVLGLALGESIGGARRGGLSDVIRAGVTTQIVAFTIDGVLRAMARMSHKGICSPPRVVWRAYQRWALGQGILVEDIDAPEASALPDLDGWLAGVPALSQRRGNAPTTVVALRSGIPGTPERPVSQSMGWHGLARVLPMALLALQQDANYVADRAREVTALTHGSAAGLDVTSAGVLVSVSCLRAREVENGLFTGVDAVRRADLPTQFTDDYAGALGAARDDGVVSKLRELAPDQTARSALIGGIYVATANPEPNQFSDALQLAAEAPDGAAVGAVTGALLGAAHGASHLPAELISRHELAWVLDVLARDAVAELVDSPGGSEYIQPRDKSWRYRYPGW